MFRITCQAVNLTAETDNLNMAILITDAVLEAIGDDAGIVYVTLPSGEKLIAAYMMDEYLIDGDVYDNLYDAQESMSYRMQADKA